MDVGRLIAWNRKRAGATQAVLAEGLGVTTRAVNNWENGRTRPARAIAASLDDVLGASSEILSALSLHEHAHDLATRVATLKAEVAWKAMLVGMLNEWGQARLSSFVG